MRGRVLGETLADTTHSVKRGTKAMGDKLPPTITTFSDIAEKPDLDVFVIAGHIKWFDVSKGFGFIVPDGGLPDILIHVTVLRRDGFQTAYEGARIVCEVLRRDRGLQAFRVIEMDESTAILSLATAAAHTCPGRAGKRLAARHGEVVQPPQGLRLSYPGCWD